MYYQAFSCFVIICGLKRSLNAARVIDNDEARLHHYLFKNYRKELRPVMNKTQPVVVKLGLTLHQIVDLVEKNQLLQTSLWIRQSWENAFLTWDPNDFGGITTINVEASKVWVPDIYLYNNVDSNKDGALNKFTTQIKLMFNGRNIWLAPQLLTSTCKIDVTYFPIDEQHCQLKFGSWTYDGQRLDLVSEAKFGDVTKYVKNGEWDLVSFPAKRNDLVYVCCPQSYPDITFTLHIRRKTTFYYMNLVMPCFLITALTLLSFVLPPESGERITLVITNLLAMIVFMLLVAEVLPPTSEVVPLISIYYSLTMFEVGLALVATCLVLKCSFTNPVTTEMPMWVRILVLRWLAKFTRVKVPTAIKAIKTELDAEGEEVLQEMLREKETFRRMSNNQITLDVNKDKSNHVRRLSSPTLHNQHQGSRKVSFFEGEFPTYSQMDFGLLTSVERGKTSAHKNSPMGLYVSVDNISELTVTQPETKLDEKTRDNDLNLLLADENPVTSMMLCRQENIANNVRRLVKMARSKEVEDLKKEEWKIVAEIIDKIFLWLFLVVLFGSTFIIFMQAPRYSIVPGSTDDA